MIVPRAGVIPVSQAAWWPACGALLALMLAGCTWSPRDRALLAVTVVCHVTDGMQTTWALRHGYVETNPLFGSHPSTATVAATQAAAAAGSWWLADKAGSDNRATALIVTTLPCLYAVAANYSHGARP